MKLYVQIIFILIVFFQTGNLLSDNKLFNVNNIQLQKKDKSTKTRKKKLKKTKGGIKEQSLKTDIDSILSHLKKKRGSVTKKE